MNISMFLVSNIITTSGVEPASVKTLLTEENGGIKLGGQSGIAEANIVAVVL